MQLGVLIFKAFNVGQDVDLLNCRQRSLASKPATDGCWLWIAWAAVLEVEVATIRLQLLVQRGEAVELGVVQCEGCGIQGSGLTGDSMGMVGEEIDKSGADFGVAC